MKRKSIQIPYAYDENGELLFCNLDGCNSAMWIVGKPGSGKSTVLNFIVDYLVHNYTSKEIEIWLTDVDGLSFSTYHQKQTSHITKIFNGLSGDYHVGLLSDIQDEIDNRLRLFAENRWRNFEVADASKRPSTLFVIVDALDGMFALCQNIFNNDEWNFNDIIWKCTMLGIKFIFTTYDSESALRRMPSLLKSQINQRLALTPIETLYLYGFLKLSKEDVEKININNMPNRYSILSSIVDGKVSFGKSLIK